jgi:hypothetical protein
MRIASDEAVFVAVGVPSDAREAHRNRILRVLDQTGYGAVEMTPDDVVAQAAHIVAVRSEAASHDNDQKGT